MAAKRTAARVDLRGVRMGAPGIRTLASDPEATKIQAYNLLNSPATKLEAQMLLAMPDNLSVYQAAAMGATMAGIRV